MIKIKKGEEILYHDTVYKIQRVIDIKTILAKSEDGEVLKIPISEIMPLEDKDKTHKAFDELSEKEWEEAKRRFEIINPLLYPERTKKEVINRAKEFSVSTPTLYRWIRMYETTGKMSSLAPRRDGHGGKGKHRINPVTDQVIKEVIEKYYLNTQKYSIKRIYHEIASICRDKALPIPGVNTVIRRIKEISQQTLVRAREGRSKALNIYGPSRSSFKADYPLSIIQIDHTPLDIIVVDQIHRKPIGRPYITVALDIYSRMVYGFYISLESPSFFSVGQALYVGAIKKERYLERLGVKGEWNIWGMPKSLIIHMDNAAEFRGNNLKKFCEEYNINAEFRPRGAPYYGGHIERFIGTLNKEIHNLPGTTFSNISERGSYKPDKKASLTLDELEKWIAEFIVNVYHKRIHSELGMSPEEKYKQGILGSADSPGIGLPDIISGGEAKRLRIALLPTFQRTVQKDGVKIDGIKYYSSILRRFVKLEETGNKKRRKFTFKRDPRDISVIYFYDPTVKDYFEIPYRNMGNPPISIWELKKAKESLVKEHIRNYNEITIFQAVKRLNAIEKEAAKRTKQARRSQSSKRRHQKKLEAQKTDIHDKEKEKKDITQDNLLKEIMRDEEEFDIHIEDTEKDEED